MYGLWLYVPTFMMKLAIFGQQVRAKMELVSIWARKYSFVNYFSVKWERKFVNFSYFFTTFVEFFFVKGTFSCESAICINKSVNKLFPENVKFKKKDYHFRTEVVQGNILLIVDFSKKILQISQFSDFRNETYKV